MLYNPERLPDRRVEIEPTRLCGGFDYHIILPKQTRILRRSYLLLMASLLSALRMPPPLSWRPRKTCASINTLTSIGSIDVGNSRITIWGNRTDPIHQGISFSIEVVLQPPYGSLLLPSPPTKMTLFGLIRVWSAFNHQRLAHFDPVLVLFD